MLFLCVNRFYSEQERCRIASLSAKAASFESEELSYYRNQLEQAKKKLAQTTEHIAVLTVQLEGEMRSNRAQIDEVEADFLRQIAKLNASLTTT